jgi:hypothetical protein
MKNGLSTIRDHIGYVRRRPVELVERWATDVLEAVELLVTISL